jgi:hypothetical protein
MNRSIEAIPTWSLCYIINGDAKNREEYGLMKTDLSKQKIEDKKS